MTQETILVVEDEEEIQELVRYNLTKVGFQVLVAATGEEALQMANAKSPALILLDLMLPGIDGLEVCRRLKGDPLTESIRVVMLTAKGEDIDIVTGLEMGADDYIPKPFSPRVLIARVRAVLRRPVGDPSEEDTISNHGLVVHPGRHEVTLDDEPVQLTATEFRVLYVLARRPGWVFTRQQIASSVHGEDDVVTDRSVDVQIVGLRKKLGPAGDLIETIRAVGYRFKE